MNGRMAHFLTAPYMSIYYNAGSERRSFGGGSGCRRDDRRRNRSQASSFVYFLLFKVGVKVNAATEKFARAVINKSVSNRKFRNCARLSAGREPSDRAVSRTPHMRCNSLTE